jgi:Secreted protein acidic and rich in cysteine Ca binding region/EF hand
MKTISTLISFAALASSPLVAQAPNAGAPLTKANVEAQVKANFSRMDANRDGFVTQAESAAARGEMIDARTTAMFNSLDADRNGQISRAEFAAAQRRALNQATGGKGIPDRDFALADSNKDGRVSLEEALAQPRRQFDAVDGNRDGVLSIDERKAAAARLRKR